MKEHLSRRQLSHMAGAAALLAGTEAHAQNEPSDALPGLREYVLSVFDIERIAQPMTEVGTFTFHALPDAPPGQFAAWHVPPACTRIEQVYLEPLGSEDGSGGMLLVSRSGLTDRSSSPRAN